MIKKIYLYIIKKFLLNLLLVILAVSLLLAMINIFEVIGRVRDNPISIGKIILLDVLQIPLMLENIAIFLVMITAMITLFSLSVRSEITVMRASGLSFWQIIFPVAATSFILGILSIFIFNPITIAASKKFNHMEQVLIEKEQGNLLAPAGGIWLKQTNVEDDQEVIIRADKIYRNNLRLENVNLWFFDKNYKFYKKIDAQSISLKEGYWNIDDAIINDKKNTNSKVKNLTIATNLQEEFVAKKILNNFEDVHLFSIYEIPLIISGLKDSGFSPRKFLVYYYSLLTKPILFTAMALIAAFFAVNNVRNKNNILWFVVGVVVGLLLYIASIIINAFGSSGFIPIFLSTWMLAIILLAISLLLIFRKEDSY